MNICKASKQSDSLSFITFLRGSAALIVVFSHLLFMFWNGAGTVGSIWPFLQTTIAPNGLLVPEANVLLARLQINFGSVGVSMFFLISGFLIKGSIQKYQKPGVFLLAKTMRIFPLYIIGFSITFGCVWLYTYFHHQDFPYTSMDWVTQVTLLRRVLNQPCIDQISWTLVADVQFYCLIAILMCFRRTFVTDMVKTGICLTLLSVICGLTMNRTLNAGLIIIYRIEAIIILASFCLTFMLLGGVLFEVYKGKIDRSQIFASCLILYSCFVICCFVYNTDAMVFVVPYTFSLFVFVACMMLFRSGHCKRLFQNKIIKGVAKISYPLYIIHGLNGYVLETALYQAGVKNLITFLLTLGAAFILAILLHYLGEKPLANLSKKILSHIIGRTNKRAELTN